MSGTDKTRMEQEGILIKSIETLNIVLSMTIEWKIPQPIPQ